MGLKCNLYKVILGLVLVCTLGCIALIVAFVLWARGFACPPFGLDVSKDSKLIAIFHAHRAGFEKLQQMATEDAQYGWYFNSSFEGANLDEKYRQEYEKDPRYAWYFKSPYFKGGKLNEARRREYKDLLSEISPRPAVSTDYDSSMRFLFAGGGIAIGPDWAKGVEYVPGSYESNGAIYGKCEINGITYRQQWAGVALTNLDGAQDLPANVYLRPIESNWFLFYQRDAD